jgi:hypothetical protein
MRPAAVLLLAAALLSGLPRPSAAQVAFDGLEGGAGYFLWAGDDFRNVEGGPRFQIGPMLRVGERWNVGVKGLYGTFDRQFQLNPLEGKELGVELFLRYSFADPAEDHFFVQLMGGFSQLDSDILGQGETVIDSYSQNGWTFGPEVGFGFAASRFLDVVWAAGATLNSYSESRIFGPDDATTGSSVSPIRFGFRVGLVFGRKDL